MDTVGEAVETVLGAVTSAGKLLYTILNLNFVLLNSLVTNLWFILSSLLNICQLLVEAIVLAGDEFKEFLSEIFGGIQAVCTLLYDTGHLIVSLTSLLTSTVPKYLCNAYIGSKSIVKNILDYTYVFLVGIKSFVGLTASSVLLILESLPWFIVTAFNVTVQLSSRFLKNFVNESNQKTLAVINHVKNVAFNFKCMVQNIPRDAYVGLLIILVLFLLYRYMRRRIIRFTKKSFRFLHTVIRRSVRGCSNVSTYIITCIRQINSYYCSLLSRLLANLNSSDANVESEQEDNDQASDGSDQESTSDEPVPNDVSQLRRELENQKGAQACIVCLENPKDVIFLPCRHMCACQQCCNILVYRRAPCPLCRNFIRNTIRVYN